MQQLGSLPMEFHEILYLSIFGNQCRILRFRYNTARMAVTLHEELCKFVIVSRSVLLGMRNVSDKHCRENRNTSCVQYLPHSPPPENRNIGKKMWIIRVQTDRPQMTIQYGACIFHVG